MTTTRYDKLKRTEFRISKEIERLEEAVRELEDVKLTEIIKIKIDYTKMIMSMRLVLGSIKYQLDNEELNRRLGS